MTKAIFTASESSEYEDLRERWYHFPNAYLAQARSAVGDLVLFYEPRRNNGPSSSGGSQSYFAMARVDMIRPDPNRVGHYFADLSEYIEFDTQVPFRENGRYFESTLQKPDGTTNKGAFGRSIRLLPDAEFATIVDFGFSRSLLDAETETAPAESSVDPPIDPIVERPTVTRKVTQKIRDLAFRHRVLDAYAGTCAVTGLRLVDTQGRHEAQAAHVRPVAEDGPDCVRNGIAMTGSVHWLFDRGLMSIADDYSILISEALAPATNTIKFRENLLLPEIGRNRPHLSYLEWHREHVYIGRSRAILCQSGLQLDKSEEMKISLKPIR